MKSAFKTIRSSKNSSSDESLNRVSSSTGGADDPSPSGKNTHYLRQSNQKDAQYSGKSIKLLVANLKMHLNAAQLDVWVEAFTSEIKLDGYQQQQVVVCPSTIHIYRAQEFFRQRGLKIKIGAQHALGLEEGSLTGEVSVSMLNGYAHYLIVGHSEQRGYSSPADIELADEISKALSFGIKPILCVGESLEQFRCGSSREFVTGQLQRVLAKLNPRQIKNTYIAYEPIWSIGSGKIPNNSQIELTLRAIKSEVSRIIGENGYVFGNILYGGSVNINNIVHLNKIKDISGYLVGSASLDPLQLAKMANWLL